MLFKDLLLRLPEWLRAFIAGGMGAATDVVALAILVEWLHFAPWLAAVVGFLAGSTLCYVLYLLFVFPYAKQDDHRRQFPAFLLTCLFGLIATEVAIYIFATRLGIHYLFVKSVVTVTMFFLNYLFRKAYLFKQRVNDSQLAHPK